MVLYFLPSFRLSPFVTHSIYKNPRVKFMYCRNSINSHSQDTTALQIHFHCNSSVTSHMRLTVWLPFAKPLPAWSPSYVFVRVSRCEISDSCCGHFQWKPSLCPSDRRLGAAKKIKIAVHAGVIPILTAHSQSLCDTGIAAYFIMDGAI
jgi:hypothetical protein